LLVGALLWCTAAAAAAGNFQRPPELEPDILFWTRVYTEVDTRGGLIHDSSYLGIVYEVLRFPESAGPRTQRRLVKAAKQRYKTILNALARGKRSDLSQEEARVLALWPEGVSNKTLRAATRRLRFQLGQSDKFRAGLVRSGIWEAHIRKILSDMDLPEELVALPHVESSFNPKARSRVGAAGMWQFMRSTGRRFMRIDRSIDERMDPYLSSIAAAKLLSHNYAATGTWPLAITSYNHGTAGMRRAARKLGTKDITRIVREYRSRRFGFASRNFYVAFLAAVEIHFNPDKYFDAIPRHSAPATQLVRVPDYVSVDTLQRSLGIDREALRSLNPALRPSIWRGAKYVPRGYELRIPASAPRDEMLAALARINEDERYGSQLRDRYYKVRRGNTLAGIAKHFEVDVDDLVAINGLKSRHRIRAGQVLALPLPDGVKVDPSQVVPSQARAASRPQPTLTAQDGRYTVRRGDSVWLIARRLGVAEETLLSLNDLGDGDRIHVGQVLQVEPPRAEPTLVAAASSEARSSEAAVGAGAVEDTGVVPVSAPVVVATAEPGPMPTDTDSVDAAAAEVMGTEAAAAEAAAAEPAAAEAAAAEAAAIEAAATEAAATEAAATEVAATEVAATEVAAAEAAAIEVAAAEAAAAEAAATEVAAAEVMAAEVGGAATASVTESAAAIAEVVDEDSPSHVSDGLIARVEQAEPVSAEEAEEIAPTLPLTVQPDLSADPSDYSVVAGETIEVQAAETLGHYADWLQVRAWRLRHLNDMRYGQPVVIGQRLSLDFSRVSATAFEHRRIAYHQALQEAFFKRYRIAGTTTHVVRRGESLWILARRSYEVPVWLLRQYNPDLDLNKVDIGVSLTVPQLQRLDEEQPAARTTTAKAG
jgi:membrane-bound lytic murein transglycosylase D